MPHSYEAEQGVLSCCLQAPQECITECSARVRVGEEVFYDLRHQVIYQAAQELLNSGSQVDVITLQQRLKDQGTLEQVGGIAYLSSLCDITPSPANLTYYLDIVHEKYLLRKLFKVCSLTSNRIHANNVPVDTLLQEAEALVLSVRGDTLSPGAADAKALVDNSLAAMEAMWQRQGAIMGMATGLTDLDRITSGQQKGDFNVLAGFPSMGKTALAMNIVDHAAVALGRPVGVFSLEMTADSLMMRMVCCRARVNLRQVRDGRLNEEDFPKITTAASQLAKAPIYFDDTSDLSVFELRARARRMWQKHAVELFVVDYLQLMNAQGGGRRVENRQQEVADIAAGLKHMAKEFKVPVLALSQLNDEGALRESRAIGQHADGVWVIQKPRKDKDSEEDRLEAGAVPIELLIKKQRNGPTGIVPLTFLKCFTRFENAARVNDDDVPPQD